MYFKVGENSHDYVATQNKLSLTINTQNLLDVSGCFIYIDIT